MDLIRPSNGNSIPGIENASDILVPGFDKQRVKRFVDGISESFTTTMSGLQNVLPDIDPLIYYLDIYASQFVSNPANSNCSIFLEDASKNQSRIFLPTVSGSTINLLNIVQYKLDIFTNSLGGSNTFTMLIRGFILELEDIN